MRKKPCSQKMAPLPKARVTTTAPFFHTGVDVAGPFLVKRGSRPSWKIWVMIFTCFQTQAVHTETILNMDADAAIQAIIRFNSRRPGLNKLYSDQGSNFTAADKILKRELVEVNKGAQVDLAKKRHRMGFQPSLGTAPWRSVREDCVSV